MTTPRPGSRAQQRRRTEARILEAAAQAFLTAGYERTTIRGVAAAAGVDGGLVMHYFGSKQELYRRVIDAAPVPEVSGTPAEATEQLLASLATRLVDEPVASLALLRSMLTNPEAASAASVGIARYQAQIAQAIPAADAELRAALISAITLGITVCRHLIGSGELAAADPARVVELLRPCLASLTGAAGREELRLTAGTGSAGTGSAGTGPAPGTGAVQRSRRIPAAPCSQPRASRAPSPPGKRPGWTHGRRRAHGRTGPPAGPAG
jgi:AcrR family transcriptional regulator